MMSDIGTAGKASLQINPQADEALAGAGLDLIFVNPLSPDGDTWIRCQYRAGQRAPDGTVWPQTALAQLAALFPDRRVAVIDAVARRLSWEALVQELERRRPRWYVTQLAGPTLASDMQCVAAAQRLGARTVAFGPIAAPAARELLWRFPALDYCLVGEPEQTLRELVDTVDGISRPPPALADLLPEADGRPRTLGAVAGLAWRHEGEVLLNPPRALLARLDDLPLPAHDLLPLGLYSGPGARAPAAMVVTGRGCPAGCCFCLKHVLHGNMVRLRSPESVACEVALLRRLGVRHVYMQADHFAVCREQVLGICRHLHEANLGLTWSCSLRVDAADEELLAAMAEAGCRRITWAVETANELLLWRCGKGTGPDQVEPALEWARRVGIHNWASFIIGLPGDTEATIRETIAAARRWPLERAVFELAVPRLGTPLWEQALGQGWLRPDARWEQGDACGPALLDYPSLSAWQLEQWLERAYREWALRPGSLWGDLRQLAGSSPGYRAPAGGR
ncbi:MAG: B12-binding domain-containing radical SAM protein [Anaerolineae bacterium]